MVASPDRIAVVTGANKGIGFFIALQLGTSGLFKHIILACRDAARGQEAVMKMVRMAADSDQCSASFLSAPLTLGSKESHSDLRRLLEEKYGHIDVLVNNAAMAFHMSDPTPHIDQCTPTLDINFRGTIDLTEELMPLLLKGRDARLVNVASKSGYLMQIPSEELRNEFTAKTLSMERLRELVNQYETDVKAGIHAKQGWGNSNYGMSKLAVIAATKVWARQYPTLSVNCICPGYCVTDMTGGAGTRTPKEGARNAVIPATMQDPPSGEFFKNFEVGDWLEEFS